MKKDIDNRNKKKEERMPESKNLGTPKCSPECFIDEMASVTGDVCLEENVIVAPSTSIRGDEGSPFIICKGTNIQDGVIIHGLLDKFVEVDGKKFSVYIGSHCSVAHGAFVHGPAKILKKTFIGFASIIHASEIGRNCFVDFRATLKNAKIGNYCHIGVGSIIKDVVIGDNKYVKDGSIITHQEDADLLPLVPASVKEADNEFNKEVVDYNKLLCSMYRKQRRRK
jgi:carbonic anhydrase/acetyltransferase-like protein (isoleucine patch superfamily)